MLTIETWSFGTLPFFIKDNQNTRPVTGATVCIENNLRCAISDQSGNGRIDSIPPGLYSLKISSSGYDTFIEPNVLVKNGINTTIVLSIAPQITSLTNMTVIGRTSNFNTPSQSTFTKRYSSFELSNTAGTANDVNRVLAQHPAVVSGVGSDFDNNLFVRGGQSCENIFIVDGIEFENTSHFSNVGQSGGAIGFINSTLVRDLEFYTGGFPARMPPRLSAVINTNLRNGSTTTLKKQVDLNMSGLGLLLEGPLPLKKGSWLANARFIDLHLLKPFLAQKGIPRFGDGVLKCNYLPTDNSVLMASAVVSMDDYKEDYRSWQGDVPLISAEKINQYGGIFSWNYSDENFTNTASISGTKADRNNFDDVAHFREPLTVNEFSYNISEYNRNKQITDSIIKESDTIAFNQTVFEKKRLWGELDKRWQVTIKDDASFSLNNLHRFAAGLNAGYRRYRIKNEIGESYSGSLAVFPGGSDSAGLYFNHWQYPSWEADSMLNLRNVGGYLEYILTAGPLKAVAGLRGDYYDVVTDYGISPRLGLRSDFSRLGSIAISAGIYYQFPSEFNGLISDILGSDPGTFINREVPLNKVSLQRCQQAVASYEKEFAFDHSLTIETYYKWYDHEYPFVTPGERQYISAQLNENTGFYENSWKLSNPKGKKMSYGIEFLLQKRKYDKLYYSGSLSIFSILNKYTNNKWYHDEMDVGKTLGLSIGSNINKHHGISMRMQLSNGRRYTPVVYNELERAYEIDSTSEYYSKHLPLFASLNLRYTFKIFLNRGNVTGYLEVLNLLNYMPVVERFFDAYSEKGFRDYECNGIFPVAGVTVDF
jgi:hypothetical protein